MKMHCFQRCQSTESMKDDRGGSRKSHLKPGIVLGTNETDFMSCVTEGAYFLIRSFRTEAYRYEWCSETLVFGKTDQNFDTRVRGRTRRSKWRPWSLDTSFKLHNT